MVSVTFYSLALERTDGISSGRCELGWIVVVCFNNLTCLWSRSTGEVTDEYPEWQGERRQCRLVTSCETRDRLERAKSKPSPIITICMYNGNLSDFLCIRSWTYYNDITEWWLFIILVNSKFCISNQITISTITCVYISKNLYSINCTRAWYNLNSPQWMRLWRS